MGRHGGLVITTVLTILFVTVLSLGALAAVGSAVSLAVFTLVAVAAFRLRRELHARASIVMAAIVVSAGVLVGFAADLWANDRRTLWVAVALVVLALIAVEIWTRRSATERETPA